MNLASVIDRHPADAVALVDGSRRLTYGELRDRVASLRGGLMQRGLKVGDRVGIIGENSIAVVEAYLAVLGIGAVAVMLNRNNPEGATAAELAAVGAHMVLVGPGAAATPGVTALVIDEVSGAPVSAVERDDRDLAALLFTSGTAGSPKAAMLTHGNLRSNLEQTAMVDGNITAADVALVILPLDHIYGLNTVVGQVLYCGASAVLLPRFDPVGSLGVIRDEKVTVVPGVPPMWVVWLGLPDVVADAFAGVRLGTSGASRLPPEVSRDFTARFGLDIREGYGLTEASPVVTTSVGFDSKPGSIGRALPGIEIRLVDDDGSDALTGDAGEIWVRGPNVFAGYWNEPAATERALTVGGWLRTGDIAVVDDEGYFAIVDRSKDLIIVSGFNVYPAEVEEVLVAMPGVADAAVCGAPSPTSGETVKAYVVPEPGVTLDTSRLLEQCLDELARYKCPTSFVVVDEIPRAASGKKLRRLLG